MPKLSNSCRACGDILLNNVLIYHQLWEYNNDSGYFDPGGEGWYEIYVECKCGTTNYLGDLGLPPWWKIAVPKRFQGWQYYHLVDYLNRNKTIGRKVDTYA